MQTLTEEVGIVLGITLMLTTITFFIVFFIIISQNHYHKYLREKVEMKNIFNQELLKAQLEIKEQTLNHISQEIHDNIGQVLSLVKLNLNTIEPENSLLADHKIQNSKELVAKAIHDLRSLSKSLNTNYISQLKFSELIQFQLDLIKRSGNYQTELIILGLENDLPSQNQVIVFRIAQEILNNIIKHAKAINIKIFLEYSSNLFLMKIYDNGIGFDITETSSKSIHEKGTGIGNMYNRANLIGGKLEVESRLQQGSTVILTLPI